MAKEKAPAKKMKNPMKGGNGGILDPCRDTETARERGHNGGIKSGIAKREKALMSKIYFEVMADEFNIEVDDKLQKMTGEKAIKTIIKRILLSDQFNVVVSLMKEIRESTEGSKIKATIDNDFEGLSDEQLMTRAKELAKIAGNAK